MRRAGFTIVELLASGAVTAVLVALLLPAVQQTREAARRVQCQNNLKQVGLALHAYHDSQGTLPPAYALAENSAGTYLQQSWTKQILPYLEQDGLYREWDVGAGAAAAGNRDLARTPLPVFRCPSSAAPAVDLFGLDGYPYTDAADLAGPALEAAVAEYFGVSFFLGPARTPLANGAGMLPYGTPTRQQPVRFRDVTDGLSNTVAVGEHAGGGRVFRRGGRPSGDLQTATLGHWAAQNRLRIQRYDGTGAVSGGGFCVVNCTNRYGVNFFGFHAGGVEVLLGDGACRFLNEDADYETVGGLCVIADGRPTTFR